MRLIWLSVYQCVHVLLVANMNFHLFLCLVACKCLQTASTLFDLMSKWQLFVFFLLFVYCNERTASTQMDSTVDKAKLDVPMILYRERKKEIFILALHLIFTEMISCSFQYNIILMLQFFASLFHNNPSFFLPASLLSSWTEPFVFPQLGSGSHH